MWVFIAGIFVGIAVGVGGILLWDEVETRSWDKEKPPAHFPKEHRRHKRNIRQWKDGWSDVMCGKLIAGSKEYLAKEAAARKRREKALESGYQPLGYSYGLVNARDVSEYTTPQWEAYMAGRTAAFDENNRRDVVGKSRVDQIDADNAKQARYQAALAEVREEIYGKETE